VQGVADNLTLGYVSPMAKLDPQHENPLAVVQAWQNAANHQDVQRLLAISDPNIEIVGPRGSGFGHQLLRDWMGRAGLNLTTRRAFVRDDTIVLAQHGVWRSVETGEVIGEADIASQFTVSGERVTKFARYDSLDEALTKSGLDQSDEKPLS
jgi:hypothetical protein